MKSARDIPIKNIYYLLCYAWDRLDEGKTVAVNTEDCQTLLDLFARVLINGTTYLFKKGLERTYLPHHELVTGIKGKWDVQTTVKRLSYKTGLTYCYYDDFSYNTIHNQILKSTIYLLLNTEQLNSKHYKSLLRLYQRFHQVDNITLSVAAFTQIRLHRNNQYYDLLLKICQLIYENSFINEDKGRFLFKDFIRDDRKMNALFEAFVKQFYATELSEVFKVHSPKITWQLEPLNDISQRYIPNMRTDIVLEARDNSRKIIIDTKFYKEALQYYHNTEKARSAHLYQIFAYLLNSRDATILNKNAEGILLYPQVQEKLRLKFQYESHVIRIYTVDLNQSWDGIVKELKDMVL